MKDYPHSEIAHCDLIEKVPMPMPKDQYGRLQCAMTCYEEEALLAVTGPVLLANSEQVRRQ